MPARLSRYSYLVSLMPEQIIADLGLDLDLRSRSVASYTPVRRDGRAHRPAGRARRGPGHRASRSASSPAPTGSTTPGGRSTARSPTSRRWSPPRCSSRCAPPTRSARPVDGRTWDALVEQPLGRRRSRSGSRDDTVRGVVATDALIGTFADLNAASLLQNRCFLYHLIGNGTGEWRVPVGGMGAVTDALAVAAREAGATIVTGAGVSRHRVRRRPAPTVTWHDGAATHARGTATGCWPTWRPGCCGCCWARTPGDAARGLAAQDQLPARPAAAAEVRASTRQTRVRGHVPRRRGLQPAPAGLRRGGGRARCRPCSPASSTATR